MSPSSSRLASLVVAAAACGIAGDARADEVPPKARALAAVGRAAHDSADYRRAIAAFEAAYVIAPSGALLFNLAQDYRLLGDCDDAVLMYRRFLATDPDPGATALAREHLAAVEKCAHPEPAAKVARVEVPSFTGLALPPPARRGTADDRARDPHRVLEGALAGAGVVALGVTIGFAYAAHQASDDVAAFYAKGGAWKTIESTDARGHRDTVLATTFGIGSAALLGAATALYFHGRHRAHEVAIGPAAHGGVQAGIAWRF